jgi:glycogen synthase
VGERLFAAVARGQWPDLGGLVDDYWWLRLRRNLHAWKQPGLPPVVTHNLSYEKDDAILNHLRRCGLCNREEDPVKVVYHPEFITPSQPLFGMDYDQFTRGCHLGIFPCLYEPWGYAPLECVVLGIPTVASDLSGFGAYVTRHVPDHAAHGITVLRRRHVPFGQSADELASAAFDFAALERRERIALRNRVESCSEQFDWSNLVRYYHQAHDLAVARLHA